ncbi:MAG TPA: GWxTD domain-containing protein [Bacteroidales bacterium]|nr:GWxTD domain-containing protein [Bacteroidales bacterium]HSA44207.1 GWxTD domain-containing protein [Bacteroidales bacterium]
MRSSIRYLLFCSLWVIGSCTVPYELSQRNLSVLYDEKAGFTGPEYALHHLSDSGSVLYYSLQLHDFSYQKTETDPVYRARIRLKVLIRDSYESKPVEDSLIVLITDSAHFQHNYLLTDSLLLTLPTGYEKLLELVLTDMNSAQEVTHYLMAYKVYEGDQQFFLARGLDGNPLYRPYITEGEAFTLEAPSGHTGNLLVRYYHRAFPIAIPPFAVDYGESFDYREDSLFSLPLQDGKTGVLAFRRPGFYHFQADSSRKEGFTLFLHGIDFPRITTVDGTLEPLRYITTSREYQALTSAASIKLAIDSFWLENCGNINRARAQIAKYYNRVQDANRYFTSYLEGWKTDRGMIYMIFGPPTHVFRDINTENWVYGDAGYSLSLRFSFVRVDNPFTYNDFNLYRNPTYKEVWYHAVENWRR